MSNVKTLKVAQYNKVGVHRESFPMARHYFDVHVNEDGIAGYFMWLKNHIRIRPFHDLKDMRKRSQRSGRSRDNALATHENNFFVPYDEIQGCVTYRYHKEIQMLSSRESVNYHFRSAKDYEAFVELLKKYVGDRVFTRDDVETKSSVYVS